ncbi:TonB-dependent receptor [Flavobacterium sp. LS1P28]|uniref:TonB-dependent receptor n=1 Tax=Flavobacterium sp. LS1P28 TaxID=2497752 RepID=UPI000F821E15|nr:TonB-dependent receptor [Flavobacterium sp. LS1P28]RTY79174.1 TonB-dependent receptor [Flavobacterium sp. LS1P28]
MKIIILIAAALLSVQGFSQSNLKGRVTDQNNQTVIGATVHIKELGNNTITDVSGDYLLSNIKEGTYSVRIEMLGYQTRVKSFKFDGTSSVVYNVTLSDDISRLDEVVISASRHSEYLSEIPASVTVIGQATLQEFAKSTSNISEILEFTVPGLAMSSGTFSNWGQTLRGRSLLVMVDGIPQSSPLRNGQLGIKSITPNDISRVEVIKGATSIFGNGGNGGFINYITKKPNSIKKFEGSTNVWGTSNVAETKDALGFGVYQSFKGNLDKFRYYISGSYEETGNKYDAKGIPLLPTYGFDNSKIYSTLGKIEYQLSANQKITLGGNFYKSTQNSPFIPVAAIVDVFNKEGDYAITAGYGEKGTIVGEKANGSILGNAQLTYNLNNIFSENTDFQTDLYYQNTENIFFYSDKFENGGQSVINAEKYGLRPNFITKLSDNKTADITLTYGVDLLRDKTNQGLLDGRLWVPNIEMISWAPYAQSTLKFNEKWVVKTGLRYDDINMDIVDYSTLPYSGKSDGNFSPSVEVQGGKLNFNNLAFNFGVRYIEHQEFIPYVSYSQGFSIADLGSVLRSATASNINDIQLEAAVTKNYEFGFLSKFNNLKFEAVGYYSTSSLGTGIVFVDELNTFQPSKQPQRIYGGEVAVDYFTSNDKWQFGTSYSYVEGTKYNIGDENNLSYLGGDVISAPKLTVYANWRPIPKVSTSIRVTNSGDRERFDPFLNVNTNKYEYRHTEFPVSGYTLVNLSLAYQLEPNLSVSLAVNNLLNEYYLPARSQWASPLKTFTGAGEGANAKVSLQYNF